MVGDSIETTAVENQQLPLTKMTLEEIYAHFQLPFDLRNSMFKGNFTKEAIARMKKQKKVLVHITEKIIDEMIEGRHLLNYESIST